MRWLFERVAAEVARLALVSTYELGEQPLGLAVPAALLGAAGHELSALDLAVEEWPSGGLGPVDGVVFSIPMHTALRLALGALDRLRAERPGLPVAMIGMYAPVLAELDLLGPRDLTSTGLDPAELLQWANGCRPGRAQPASCGPRVPRRDLLPPLERYAKLEQDGVELLVGAVESTTGCNHRCRHCPVPLVYDGRSHVIDLSVVLADVGQLVDLGAGHIHFADPDFLNRPQHARRVAAAIAAEHPGLSFDVTAKVSHLLRHASLIPELAEAGLAFVISAFESTSDLVLDRLDKGHHGEDLAVAIEALRCAGVEPRPSLLPFTPWTERRDLVELLDFVLAYDLVWNVDPVQYAIRLLLPPGSPLLEDPDVADAVLGYDPTELGFSWRHRDPLLDELAHELSRLAESLADKPYDDAYQAVRSLVFHALGERDPGPPPPRSLGRGDGPSRPRLSESWFCCAEPTSAQLGRLGPAPEPVAVPLGPPRRSTTR